ncbi:hypothetical protein [Bradyrhizobium japonicum]|uniref:hypothetical protein n=1 Tax=Bradyrhizobium japonicum TaxID=375 RepID=UPI0012FDA8F2|nr:hypothetical protein [Bradyrhizobium japonicum]
MESGPKGANKRLSYAVDQSPLYRLRSHRKLAALLGISVLDLRKLRHSQEMYREFDLPKKGGGSRRIENPARNLKRTQAKLARLLTRIDPPNYLYCPVKGRSYISNAAQHLNNRVVRCLDIKKYFPSTPSHRRAGPGCLDSAPLDLSGFLPEGAFRGEISDPHGEEPAQAGVSNHAGRALPALSSQQVDHRGVKMIASAVAASTAGRL